MDQSASEFYFELSANGEQTKFNEVEGVSTEVVSGFLVKKGENPFKYKLPSLPKASNLILKKGQSKPNSKLMQWCAQPDRSRASLSIKNREGKSLVEWTLFNAHPLHAKSAKSGKRSAITEIEDLELGYSFYTLSKK